MEAKRGGRKGRGGKEIGGECGGGGGGGWEEDGVGDGREGGRGVYLKATYLGT